MKKEVGLWIDHRKAVIVIIADEEEEIRRIRSNLEKRVRADERRRRQPGRRLTRERPRSQNQVHSKINLPFVEGEPA